MPRAGRLGTSEILRASARHESFTPREHPPRENFKVSFA
jgi:hypothetical protein